MLPSPSNRSASVTSTHFCFDSCIAANATLRASPSGAGKMVTPISGIKRFCRAIRSLKDSCSVGAVFVLTKSLSMAVSFSGSLGWSHETDRKEAKPRMERRSAPDTFHLFILDGRPRIWFQSSMGGNRLILAERWGPGSYDLPTSVPKGAGRCPFRIQFDVALLLIWEPRSFEH